MKTIVLTGNWRATACCLLAGILLVPIALRADEPRALFRAGFDGTTDAIGPDGEVVRSQASTDVSPGVVGQDTAGTGQFVPGRAGKGLQCADGFRVVYPSASHIRLAEGTVELWVRPEDWHASNEKRHHVFFEMAGPRGWMVLYRYYEPGRGLFFLVNDNLKKNWQTAEAPLAWEPGQWHHLAIGWNQAASLIRLHIDGQLVRELSYPVLPFPEKLAETFAVGDAAWGAGLKRSTTVEGFIIWDRLLSPARIALHARGDFTTAPPLTADSVFLRTEAEGDGERWHYELRLLEAGTDAVPLKAEIAVSSGAGKPPVWKQETAGALCPGPTGGMIDLSTQPAGEYLLTCRLLQGSQSVADITRSLWKFDPVWQREVVNVDRVLPPWTPVTVESDGPVIRLGCWNRSYSFAGGLLPAQITSGGEPLLAGPIQIEARLTGGKPIAWKARTQERGPRKVPAVEHHDHFATFSLAAEAGGLTCTAQVRLEFDGALFTDLALSGEQLEHLETLSLILPLRADQVRYVHRTDAVSGGVNTVIGSQNGTADHGAFNPYLWIGGNERGLAFFTDTNRCWPNSLKPDAFAIIHQGDRVWLRLNLLKTGQVLPQPWKFRFGLLATPVKPWPADWRRGRIQTAEKPTIWVVWPNEEQWKMFGHPDFKDPAAMKAACAESWRQGIRPIQYNTLHQLSSAAPEWQVYGRRWALIGGWNDTFCEMNLQTPFLAVCAASGWGRYWSWRMAKAIRDYDYGGLYFDNCFTVPCANAAHGHGPWAEGVYDYQIEALRDVYRRLYAAVKDQHADGVVVQHMSGSLNLFLQAYADYTLDGEHLASKAEAADGHYTKMLTLDEIRGEYMGRPGGVSPLLLPKIPAAIAYDPVKGPARTREMMALLLLHDIHLWAAYCHYETATALQKVMDRFGWLKHADFLPYFSSSRPASVAGQNVFASVYSRPEDQTAVVVVANLRPENVKTRLTVQLGALGIPENAIARDAETGDELGSAAKIDLNVRTLDLRLVFLAPKDAAPVWEHRGVATEQIERAERAANGDFERVNKFDPKAGGWPQESVARGWKIGDEIPAGWVPLAASRPGVLRVLHGKAAHSGQVAFDLGEYCLVSGPQISVKPGQVYRICYWARGGGQASVSGIKYGTKDGKTIFLRTEPLVAADLTPEWKQYLGVFRPTPDVEAVVVLLTAASVGDHASFDDLSIRQISEIEGREIDTFAALRKDGLYLESPAALPKGLIEKAKNGLAQAQRELDAALKLNPDSEVQKLAAQVRAEAKRFDQPPSPGSALATPGAESIAERVNRLNGLARVAREAVAGLNFVDVRREH